MAHTDDGKLRISQSLIGNTRRLGTKQSESTKLKIGLAAKRRVPWNKGKKLSDETCHKMSVSRLGRSTIWLKKPRSEQDKERLRISSKAAWQSPEIRKKYHSGLIKTKWIKVRSDVGQLELLEKWNRLGFQFEPNYQIRTSEDLFFVDGYDPINNVVIEYDGKYHKKPYQQIKDFERQVKIIDTLNPKKFWRYDAVNKQFRNAIG